MTELPTITLYRQVNIKSIVTPQLREFLVESITAALRNSFSQYQAVETEAKRMMGLLKKEPNSTAQINQIQNQLKIEYQTYFQGTDTLKKRLDNAKLLKDGEFFSEGTLDGLVQLKVGDNFYSKMRSVTLLLKDGVIQKIIEEK